MELSPLKKIALKLQVGGNRHKKLEPSAIVASEVILIDFLHEQTKLSKSLLKKILGHGGVFYHKATAIGSKPPRHQLFRIRRAQATLKKGEWIFLFYDPTIAFPADELQKKITPLKLERDFSVWLKPANILTQGTEFGDEGSLIRYVEKYFEQNKKGGKTTTPYLIHRLDRETAGPVLIGHSGKTAQILSRQFEQRQVEKRYYAIAVSPKELKIEAKEGSWTYALNNQDAVTHFDIKKSAKIVHEGKTTWYYLLLLRPQTGRLHQLRRHCEMAGFPLWGDPKYGRDNKNQQGLQLMCAQLTFSHPQNGKKITIELPTKDYLDLSVFK